MSNAFRIKGAGPIGVGAPVINSANVFLQAGFDYDTGGHGAGAAAGPRGG